MQKQRFGVITTRPLLTTAEYAELRNCSIRTIEAERSEGTGAKYYKINGMVRYRVEDINDFFAAAQRGAIAGGAK
jgi:predicted transcriptional regulator